MFGSETPCSSFDMSEFRERHTVARLTGARPATSGRGRGQITEALRAARTSIVVFDEIVKALPWETFNMLLLIMEEGHLSTHAVAGWTSATPCSHHDEQRRRRNHQDEGGARLRLPTFTAVAHGGRVRGHASYGHGQAAPRVPSESSNVWTGQSSSAADARRDRDIVDLELRKVPTGLAERAMRCA